MPFDNTPEGRLTLADLSWRLRNPDTWPADFVWHYAICNTCAMGLAWQLSGGGKAPFRNMAADTALKLTLAALADGEDAEPVRGIFLFLHVGRRQPVTPDDVADAIDSHLAQKVCV